MDEVNNGSVSNGGRQLVPGLLYIDDKAPKYKVCDILMIEMVFMTMGMMMAMLTCALSHFHSLL